ncbi:hypothetical protein ACFL35_17420 [Candidatus Riflebacteria bacterium]
MGKIPNIILKYCNKKRAIQPQQEKPNTEPEQNYKEHFKQHLNTKNSLSLTGWYRVDGKIHHLHRGLAGEVEHTEESEEQVIKTKSHLEKHGWKTLRHEEGKCLILYLPGLSPKQEKAKAWLQSWHPDGDAKLPDDPDKYVSANLISNGGK